MMRTEVSGMPRQRATPLRALKGTCVEDQIVTWSPCHSAITARGSIGAACCMSAT